MAVSSHAKLWVRKHSVSEIKGDGLEEDGIPWLLRLPCELQRIILSLLNGESLRNACKALPQWKELSRGLWKGLCVFPPGFPSVIQLSSSWEETYFKLDGLDDAWERGKPHFRLLDCKPETWSGRVVHPGIYDMVLSESKLVISIYDSLHVLNLNGLPIVTINSDFLDGGGDGKCLCFYADEENIFCGSQIGKIKVFNADSGQPTGVYSRINEAIVDMRIKNGLLYTITHRGTIDLWALKGSEMTFLHMMEYSSIPSTYSDSSRERLLDTDGSVLATSFNDSLIIASIKDNKQDLVNVTECNNECAVLCFVVFGSKSLVAVGLRQGGVKLYAPSGDGSHYFQAGFYVTPFADNIISISAYGEDRLAFGDVNGDIHVCKVKEDQEGNVLFNANSIMYSLQSRHSFGAFVWAIKMDATRIYSGDSNFHLIIHDFWA